MDEAKGRFDHLIRAVLARPWAIDEESEAWGAICDVLAMRAAGIRLTDDEIQARIDAATNGPRFGGNRNGSVAVVPLYGVISPRANLMSAMSGGTTAEGFSRNLKAAAADPDVTGILIDVDSPGGNVQGISEAAAVVREARGQGKPIVAIANHTAASAAYWIASQADELVVTPSGSVGSIGVVGAHQDISEAQAKLGIKTTLISAGKYKTEGNPYGPLSDEALAARQADANTIYGAFLADVARGRGVPVAKVRADFGEGRMVLAAAAKTAGMVDQVDTFDNTLRRLGAGNVKSAAANVPAEPSDDTEANEDAGDGVVIAEAVGGVDDVGTPDPTPDQPADAGPNPPARARSRHDLDLIEAMVRGGHGWPGQ